jgi:hypothetical protein
MAEIWLARQAGLKGFAKLVVIKRLDRALASDPDHVGAALQTLEAAGLIARTDRGFLLATPPDLTTGTDLLTRYRQASRPATDACSTSLARQKLDQLVAEVVPELQQAVRDIEFELRRCPLLVHSITS